MSDASAALYLARQHHAAGRLEMAEGLYRQVLQAEPRRGDVHYLLAGALMAQGQGAAALAELRTAVECDPANAQLHADLGGIHFSLGSGLQGVEATYRQLVQSLGRDPHVHFYLGRCLAMQGLFDQAIAEYDQAIAADPDYVDAHYYGGLARLAEGDFVRGWVERDWRHKQLPRTFAQPAWDGRPLDNQRVFAYLEEGLGLGDVFQFVRYVPLVEEQGGEVYLETPPALIPLLARSGFERLIAAPAQPPPACDFQVSLWSLPGCFGTTVDRVPAPIPYLSPDPALVASWRAELQAHDGLRVGILWQGSTRWSTYQRSFPLAQFEPLARVSGVRLISLQKVDGLEQLAALRGRFPVEDFGRELDEAHGPFMDTAAIMQNLDLIVTCDTALAHLAGALGRPVWVPLAAVADWRWMRNRDDSPWYPSMRLFRQSTPESWHEPFARMASELARLVAK